MNAVIDCFFFQGKHNFSHENFCRNKKGFAYAKNIVWTVMLCLKSGVVWAHWPGLARAPIRACVHVCVCVCVCVCVVASEPGL